MGRTELGVLAHARVPEVLAFLGESDAAVLVDSLRNASDAEISRVIDRDDVRAPAIEMLVARIGEFVIPAQLRGVGGTARIEVTHRGAVESVHLLTIGEGRITAAAGDASTNADVVLRTAPLDVLRLVSGERNAGLEYIAGRLAIEGDAGLALALGGMFPSASTAGSKPVPVDPRALDPVEVAQVLHGVDTAHLRSVMASGFREVVLDEIFSRLPAYVNTRRARGNDITIGFRLTGRPDEQVDRYVVTLANGTATVLAGADADDIGRDARHATVTCEAHDFLRLATGHLGAVTGVLKGQLKVRGDKTAALRLATAFDIPSAVA